MPKRQTTKKPRPAWAWRMHQRMREKRLTNLALGLALGHPDGGRIGHYRRGRNEPSFEDLLGICAALECSLDWLVKGEEGTLDGTLAFEAQFAAFRQALLAGEHPADIWERTLERPLTDAERQLVDADVEGLREYLRDHPLAAWELLDGEAQAAVGRVVELLVRDRPGTRRVA